MQKASISFVSNLINCNMFDIYRRVRLYYTVRGDDRMKRKYRKYRLRHWQVQYLVAFVLIIGSIYAANAVGRGRKRRKISAHLLQSVRFRVIIQTQRNKRRASEYERRIRCRAHRRHGMLGDKEITVRIRSNSHCRISVCYANGPVGMLIAL